MLMVVIQLLTDMVPLKLPLKIDVLKEFVNNVHHNVLLVNNLLITVPTVSKEELTHQNVHVLMVNTPTLITFVKTVPLNVKLALHSINVLNVLTILIEVSLQNVSVMTVTMKLVLLSVQSVPTDVLLVPHMKPVSPVTLTELTHHTVPVTVISGITMVLVNHVITNVKDVSMLLPNVLCVLVIELMLQPVIVKAVSGKMVSLKNVQNVTANVPLVNKPLPIV